MVVFFGPATSAQAKFEIDVQLYGWPAAVVRLEARQKPGSRPPPAPNLEDKIILCIAGAIITAGTLCIVGIIC